MTLKEKLQEEAIHINAYSFKLTKESAEQFEVIADEFAIGFAGWFLIKYQENVLFDNVTIEKTLEIYKKEKKI